MICMDNNGQLFEADDSALEEAQNACLKLLDSMSRPNIDNNLILDKLYEVFEKKTGKRPIIVPWGTKDDEPLELGFGFTKNDDGSISIEWPL